MEKFSLIMVLHNHQPVGNFDHVFAYAVERCYRPVLDILSKYPEFRLGLHYSGPLISWLEKNDPAYLDQVASLVSRGQVEMLSGGYYEPLLASIPAADAVAQMDKLTEYTERRFGARPRGFWLAERIWEPGLPAKLAPAGLEYTLVDDTHLYYAGLKPGDMFGYHLTEREGHALALLPTHKELRYTIPFQEPQVTLDFLRRSLDEQGPACAVYGDDGEKFGLWPGTYEWVIEKGWLTRFIEGVLDASDWLVTSRPSDYLDRNPAVGRVYLPTASYEEMLTWALPAQTSLELETLIKELEAEGRYEYMRRFLRGGIWDNFLMKYRESNLMHKRMLYVSRKLHQGGGPESAWDHLYQAQCNCSYWHGLFGGLYLGHIRHAVHQHLIAAEDEVDSSRRSGPEWAGCKVEDLDLDGADEVVVSNARLDAVIHPAYGGSVSVLDLREQRFNLAGALTRRQEAYHAHFSKQPDNDENSGNVKSIHDQVVFKEEGLEEYLIYDWYQRGMFQDHILLPEAELEDFMKLRYAELGDFLDQPYQLTDSGKKSGAAWCNLSRAGNIWAPDGPWPLKADKNYTLGPDAKLGLDYTLTAAAEQTPPLVWGVELNFSLLSESDPGKRLETAEGQILGLDQPEQSQAATELNIINETDGFSINLKLSPPARIWCFPIQTVSQSESGLERTYQGSSLTLLWDLKAGRGVHKLGLEMAVSA